MRRLPRRDRGQGAGGGQGPLPGDHQPRTAHADHRRAGFRQHAGEPVGQADRHRPAQRGRRRSPSGPDRSAGSSSNCCSVPGRAPTSSPVTNGPFDLAALLRGAAVALPAAVRQAHAARRTSPTTLPAAYGDAMATDIIARPAAGERLQVLTGGRHGDGARPARGGPDRGHGRRRGHRHPGRATASGSSSGSCRARPVTVAGSAGSASGSTSCAGSPGRRAPRSQRPPAPGGGTRMRVQLCCGCGGGPCGRCRRGSLDHGEFAGARQSVPKAP